MRSRAGSVTEISVTGMKNFRYEHSSPGDRDEIFLTKECTMSRGKIGI